MTPIDTLIEQLEFDAKTLNWKTFHEAAVALRQLQKDNESMHRFIRQRGEMGQFIMWESKQ